ncbi:MAG: phosphate ABC transporter permease subunit PstC [Acidobacteriota bacterium]
MWAWTGRAGHGYVLVSTITSTLFVVLIVAVLLAESWPAINQVGWGVLSLEWSPHSGRYGMLALLYGSAMVTAIALVLAVPLGVLAAIYTSEILAGRYRLLVKSGLEILAGIPSIIYGLIGVAFFSLWIAEWFDLQSGRTLFTAGILLAMMILPMVITLTDDALRQVPKKYRESATGLGFYRFEVILRVVVPLAATDMAGAVLLALGRALGETMAVMLVIGGIDRIPSPFFNLFSAGQTVTSKLGREIPEAAFGSTHFSALILTSLLLLLINLTLTAVAQYAFKSERRLVE